MTGAVIGISGKSILYALCFFCCAEGITQVMPLGISLFYESSVEQAPGGYLRYGPAGQKDAEPSMN